MAPRKKLGHKGVIKLAGTAIACVRNFDPPEKSRESVEVGCLGELIVEKLDSDPPDVGMLKLDLVWEPGAVNSELLDTLFGNADPTAREGAFTIEWSMFTPLVTDAFSGRILKLTPAKVESKSVVSRTVEIMLTTAVTRTVAA